MRLSSVGPGIRRRTLTLVVGGLLVGLAGLAAAGQGRIRATATAQPTPNVVLIVADDMRYDGLQAMPALGRLAERGVSFSHYYVTTPLCCPSRASTLTGLYARNHGVLTNEPPSGGLERFDSRSTLATWLQSAGARTGLVGRYLNGYRSLEMPPGWDYWFALWEPVEAGDRFITYSRYYANDNGVSRYFGSEPDDHSTRVIAEQAKKFIQADDGRPFFLLVTPRTPHAPADPDPLDTGKYADIKLPLPPSYNERDVQDKPRLTSQLAPLTRVMNSELKTFRRQQLKALLGLDRAIESIAETLRAAGRLDRTWIIFTSDNGLILGEHRWTHQKKCAYEECVHVPLIVVPPDGFSGTQSQDRMVANIDLAPTIAAILGATPTARMDGLSLLDLLQDPSSDWRDALVLEAWADAPEGTFQGVRTQDRKYVRYESGEEELYDAAADPYELQNLAGHPAWADEKATLSRRLEQLLNESVAR